LTPEIFPALRRFYRSRRNHTPKSNKGCKATKDLKAILDKAQEIENSKQGF